MCWDPVHNYVLMTGPTPTSSVGETWSWNGVTWTLRATTGGGAQASCRACAFHPPTNEALAFSTQSGLGVTSVSLQAWDGAAWQWRGSAQFPASNPTPAVCAGHDPVRGESIAWLTNSQVAVWDGTTLTVRNATSSTSFDGFSSIAGSTPAMAWDPSVQRLVVSGTGQYLTWLGSAFTYMPIARFYEWNGFGWNQRLPATPPRFASGAMALDTARQRIVMVDGDSVLAPGALEANHTWCVVNGICTRLSTSIEPSLRQQSSMAFDPTRGVCVLFGGVQWGTGPMGDTWEFDLGALATFSTFGTGCQGSFGIPTIAAQNGSLPRIGANFTLQANGLPWNSPAFMLVGLSDTDYGGIPLPLDLGPVGAPGCRLYASGDLLYLLTSVLGSAQWSFAIPPVPGVSFYTQAITLDPVNPLGLTSSNAGHGLIGLGL